MDKDNVECWTTKGHPPGLFRRFEFENYSQLRIFLDRLADVGKTTVAMNMAAGLIRRRGSCIVIDSDPQGSATLWTELSGDPNGFVGEHSY